MALSLFPRVEESLCHESETDRGRERDGLCEREKSHPILMYFFCSSLFISLLLWVLPSIRSMADCCPLLEVADMILMGNRPDPLCVFTYVQALCHHLSKIEKERREQEEEKKTANDGGEECGRATDGEEMSTEKKEGEVGENGKTGGQEIEDKPDKEFIGDQKNDEGSSAVKVDEEDEKKDSRQLVGAQA